MPPFVALLLCLVLLFALLIFDPARDRGVSPALWVPLIWLFILGSRLPTQWLGIQSMSQAAQVLEEGNPLNRTFFSLMIVLAIGILLARSIKWGEFFVRNIALVAFVFFALLSVFWSDSPFVSFKRWFRDLGNYLVPLVVLSDPRPIEAVRTLLRRLCYLLIPLSVLMVKYYPNLGKQYDQWTGVAQFVGATTSKNMLGFVCLVSMIFFFWDTVTRWSTRKERATKQIIWVNIIFIAMTSWLLNIAHSATSSVCLAIGCLVIVLARSTWAERHPGLLRMVVPASFCFYLILAFGFDYNGQLASAVGRDPTLTDRTAIWSFVLNLHTNPVFGTGYESFWLGPRLQTIWRSVGQINEAHNGYLEVYLNLGFIGLFLLAGVLFTSYRNICKQLAASSSVGALNLALWAIMLFYNMTEVGFRGGLMWITFLLGAITVSGAGEVREPTASLLTSTPTGPVFRPPLTVARQRR